MAGNTVGRHRREGFPFVESRRDGSHRYRRNVPDDLRNIIGDAWVTTFPASTPLEKVSEISSALAMYHESIIEQKRKLLGLAS